MSSSFARFLSLILHPILMPSYVLWFLLHQGGYYTSFTDPFEKAALYLLVVTFTLLLPITFINRLLKSGRIKSFEMETRQERVLPFTGYLIMITAGWYLMVLLRLPALPSVMVLGAAVAVAVALVITLRWKISIHMVGIGGVMGVMTALASILIIDLSMPIVLTLLVSGLLGSARLSLGAHKPWEVYTGFIAGFLSEFLVMTW